MAEHPIEQAIKGIQIDSIEGSCAGYDVGRGGVTRIEACEKSGMYSNIPYVRVWTGDVCEAEFCQHNIVGVYFAPAEEVEATAATDDIDPACPGPHPDGKECRNCWIPF